MERMDHLVGFDANPVSIDIDSLSDLGLTNGRGRKRKRPRKASGSAGSDQPEISVNGSAPELERFSGKGTEKSDSIYKCVGWEHKLATNLYRGTGFADKPRSKEDRMRHLGLGNWSIDKARKLLVNQDPEQVLMRQRRKAIQRLRSKLKCHEECAYFSKSGFVSHIQRSDKDVTESFQNLMRRRYIQQPDSMSKPKILGPDSLKIQKHVSKTPENTPKHRYGILPYLPEYNLNVFNPGNPGLETINLPKTCQNCREDGPETWRCPSEPSNRNSTSEKLSSRSSDDFFHLDNESVYGSDHLIRFIVEEAIAIARGGMNIFEEANCWRSFDTEQATEASGIVSICEGYKDGVPRKISSRYSMKLVEPCVSKDIEPNGSVTASEHHPDDHRESKPQRLVVQHDGELISVPLHVLDEWEYALLEPVCNKTTTCEYCVLLVGNRDASEQAGSKSTIDRNRVHFDYFVKELSAMFDVCGFGLMTRREKLPAVVFLDDLVRRNVPEIAKALHQVLRNSAVKKERFERLPVEEGLSSTMASIDRTSDSLTHNDVNQGRDGIALRETQPNHETSVIFVPMPPCSQQYVILMLDALAQANHRFHLDTLRQFKDEDNEALPFETVKEDIDECSDSPPSAKSFTTPRIDGKTSKIGCCDRKSLHNETFDRNVTTARDMARNRQVVFQLIPFSVPLELMRRKSLQRLCCSIFSKSFTSRGRINMPLVETDSGDRVCIHMSYSFSREADPDSDALWLVVAWSNSRGDLLDADVLRTSDFASDSNSEVVDSIIAPLSMAWIQTLSYAKKYYDSSCQGACVSIFHDPSPAEVSFWETIHQKLTCKPVDVQSKMQNVKKFQLNRVWFGFVCGDSVDSCGETVEVLTKNIESKLIVGNIGLPNSDADLPVMEVAPLYGNMDICDVVADLQRLALLERFSSTYVVPIHIHVAARISFLMSQVQ